MEFIQDSPEHHFLTALEKIRSKPENWRALHLALSRKFGFDDLIRDPEKLLARLDALYQDSLKTAEDFSNKLAPIQKGYLYHFQDGDIILLSQTTTGEESQTIQSFNKTVKEHYPEKLCKEGKLLDLLYHFQKIADQKLLTTKRIKAYKALADKNMVSSIPVRRKKNEPHVVLVVEDDRFTSNYAAKLLSNDYEVIQAKTGEDAICQYIEHAPSIVFLDIHLPGISGHETLRAIRKADPKAHVIMLSVDTVKKNILAASEEGADGFLKKPFTKDRLLALVSHSPYIKKSILTS